MTKIELLRLYSQKIREGVMPSGLAPSGACEYRSPDGRKCAVGVLILDDVWTAYRMKSQTTSAGAEGIAALLKDRVGFDLGAVVEGLDVSDLQRIQNAHDAYATSPKFRAGFFAALRYLPCFSDVPGDVWEEVSK